MTSQSVHESANGDKEKIIVWAIHPFHAEESDEIDGFEVGDKIEVIEKDEGFNDGWWRGTCLRTMSTGIFPSNFVISAPVPISTPPSPTVLPSLESATAEVSSSIPSLPDDAEQWSVDEVCRWVGSLDGFQGYELSFREHQMDGKALLSPFLDVSALKEVGIIPLERRLFFMGQIAQLKKSESIDRMAVSNSFSVSSIPSVSSAAIMRKSPFRQKKPRSQTVDITPKIPKDIQSLADVLLMPSIYHSSSDWETCDYQGYLYKRGGHAHWSWKKRFFVLKNMTLWYFRSDSRDAKCLGLVTLPSYQVLPAVNTNVKNGVFTFIATHPDARTYWFRAQNVNDMTGWMNAMVRASIGLPPLNATVDDEGKESEPLGTTVMHVKAENVNKEGKKIKRFGNKTVQMDALVRHVQDLQMQGKRFPHSILHKAKSTEKLSLSKIPSMTAEEMETKDKILESVNLKSSMEYVLWINSVLFATDTVSFYDSNGEERFIEIPKPPKNLEPVKHLHLEVTDGTHLIEFILRLVAKSMISAASKTTLPEDLEHAVFSMFKHYRSMSVQEPQYRLQMIDNLHNVWRIITAECEGDHRLTFWLNHIGDAGSSVFSGYDAVPRDRESVITRLESLGVTIDGIYQGNLEQILLFVNEVSLIFPMDD